MARKRSTTKSAVPVTNYTRTRFGKRESIRRHGRGPRAKSPNGYRTRRTKRKRR